MEMPRLWKSQTDFHRRLEISPRTRDSHIPTADPHRTSQTDEEENGNKRVTDVSGLICYLCFRLRKVSLLRAQHDDVRRRSAAVIELDAIAHQRVAACGA